jgi:hypothetical protein
VPAAGFEPARAFAQRLARSPRLPISPRRHHFFGQRTTAARRPRTGDVLLHRTAGSGYGVGTVEPQPNDCRDERKRADYRRDLPKALSRKARARHHRALQVLAEGGGLDAQRTRADRSIGRCRCEGQPPRACARRFSSPLPVVAHRMRMAPTLCSVTRFCGPASPDLGIPLHSLTVRPSQEPSQAWQSRPCIESIAAAHPRKRDRSTRNWIARGAFTTTSVRVHLLPG